MTRKRIGCIAKQTGSGDRTAVLSWHILFLFLFNCSTSPRIYYQSDSGGPFVNSGRTVRQIMDNAEKCDESCQYNEYEKRLIIGNNVTRSITGFGSPGRFEIRFATHPDVNGLVIKSITFTPAPIENLIGYTPRAETFYLPHSSIERIYSDFSTGLMGSIRTTNQEFAYAVWASGASSDPIVFDDPALSRSGARKPRPEDAARMKHTNRRQWEAWAQNLRATAGQLSNGETVGVQTWGGGHAVLTRDNVEQIIRENRPDPDE